MYILPDSNTKYAVIKLFTKNLKFIYKNNLIFYVFIKNKGIDSKGNTTQSHKKGKTKVL